MFIVGLFGGLASQMNQYAFMKSLEYHYPDVEIKMAIGSDWLKELEHNGYELDYVFGIERNEASKKEIIRLANFYPGSGYYARGRNLILNIKNKFWGEKTSQITYKDPTVFHEDIFKLDSKMSKLFWGNWSDEQYFNDVKEQLLEDFRFKNELDTENQIIMDEIIKTNSISVHIRRGDYLKYDFPCLSIEYYKKAIEYMETLVDTPFFYFFSDDIEYVEEHFGYIKNKYIVKGNRGKKSYVDMQLMSICKHNIIANSGFSFWGAWLNTNSDKIVIAPSQHVPWCKNPVACKEWILM